MMVSTLASGDVGPYVDVSDIVIMPSITDLAGLNSVSRMVLRNAAFAIVGMTGAPPRDDGKASTGLTMFGVTTPCVTEPIPGRSRRRRPGGPPEDVLNENDGRHDDEAGPTESRFADSPSRTMIVTVKTARTEWSRRPRSRCAGCPGTAIEPQK
jgi:hypothetical protein